MSVFDSRPRLGSVASGLGRGLSRAASRAWTSVRPPTTPDFSVELPVDHRALWLAQLARTRYALEQARLVLLSDGWTSGAWFSVTTETGRPRRVSATEAYGYLAPETEVVNGCLVGTLLRMADDPDQVPTVGDVWHCVDELYEAVHESLGNPAMAPGRSYPHAQRRMRLQGVTSWNDEPGRTRQEVVDVVDRAIARTIVASCD